MIATDTYPDLDDAHIEAVFAAARQAVGLALAGDARLLQRLPEGNPYDPDFVRRFAATMVTVAWKLTEPNHVYSLASVAEELAFKCIVDLAGRDGQLEEFAEVLLEDDEYARAPLARWFEPFSDTEQVHPFLQADVEQFRQLWTDPSGDEDLEDPTTEVFIAMGEDWLDVPDQVADQIPAVIEETSEALFPDRKLSMTERQEVYDSAAEDVRMLLQAARQDDETAYDVWLISQGTGRRTRYRLYAGLPLEEALTMRKLERMGDYRGATGIEVRVYPVDHGFDPSIVEVSTPPRI